VQFDAVLACQAAFDLAAPPPTGLVDVLVGLRSALSVSAAIFPVTGRTSMCRDRLETFIRGAKSSNRRPRPGSFWSTAKTAMPFVASDQRGLPSDCLILRAN